MIYPSLFSSADPACYVPEPMPQLKQIMEAAIYDPISNMGSELLQNLLYATGNAALIEAAKAKALTPEQLALLNNVSSDPQVAAELEKFQDKLSNAVAQGIQQASDTALKPAQEAVGQLVNGTINTVLDDLKDIPPIGLISSALTAVQTGVDAVENATDIADKLKKAAAPVTQAMAEVGDLTTAMNNAVPELKVPELNVPELKVPELNAAPAAPRIVKANYNREIFGPHRYDYPEGDVGETEFETARTKFQNDKQEKRQALNAAKMASQPSAFKMQTGTGVAPTQEITPEKQGIVTGGSRKRRHIHKLSRRIERTMRRVQKKYGLKDKNDFLRRSLRRHKGHKGL